MRRRRRSGSALAAPPLVLLLLFFFALCLRDISPFASAQQPDADSALSLDDERAEEISSSALPSIDDVAPNAVVSTLRGSPRWQLPHLFVRRSALVECEGGQDFRVYVARDATLLAQAIASNAPPAWCGWKRAAARAARGALRGGGGGGGPLSLTSRLLGPFASSSSSPASSSSAAAARSLPPCEARLPTFGPSAIAVIPRGSGGHPPCRISTTRRLDPALVARLLLGAALFLLARALAASASFRVSAGAVSFALASLLVVLFLVARAVPNKRQLAVAAAAMGSGALTLARLLFGHWVPTLSELASAKVLGAYSACSLAAGAAVAFWFDDPGAAKAHAILAAALRLAGLALVAGGVSAPAVGLALAGALALFGLAGPGVFWAPPLAEWREKRRRKRAEEAGWRGGRRAREAAAAADEASPRSPLRNQQASPPLQQQQQQRSPDAALRQRSQRSASVSTAAFESPERSTFPAPSPQRTSRGGGGGDEGGGGGRSPQSRSPLLFFSRRPASPAAVVSAPRPEPPLLFTSAAAVPLPSAHEEEEEEEEEEEREQSRGRESEQRRRTTTTSEHRPSQQQEQQQSGWQREEQHPQRFNRAAATSSAATPKRSFQRPQQQQQQSLSHAGSLPLPLPLRSPLVDRGLLLNEATGKTIKIGAATYNRLVLEGYTVDEARGTLSPPVRARRRQEGGDDDRGGGGEGTRDLRPRTRNG